MNSMTVPVLECRGVNKRYVEGRLEVDVLHQIDFAVLPGERVAIVGTSGSGKSTLLNLLGGLDCPTKGAVLVDGCDMATLGDAKRGEVRNQKLGFIYQFHHLLPEFSALENVCIPLLIRGELPEQAKKIGRTLLEEVGLGDRLRHKPAELSGGERQRAAVARALVTQPCCVLADEPTGNLDPKTAQQVYERMLSLNVSRNTSLVVVTHDMNLARKMDRVLRIENGSLVPEFMET